MTRFRSITLLLAAAVLSAAMIACDSEDDAAEDGDSSATATATAPVAGTSTPSPTGTPSDTPAPTGTAGEGSSGSAGGGTSGSPGGGTGGGEATPPATGTPGGGDEPVSSDDPTPPSTTPSPTPTPTDGDGFERVEELAPIEEIDVLMLESFPVQYRLRIVSGLPSGCAAFAGAEVEQQGTTFIVTVMNTVPAPGQQVSCTMIYGYHESSVSLGTGLESGTEYTVKVNDKATTFVAQ